MSGKVFMFVFGSGIYGFSLISVDLKMGDIFMTIFLGGELIVSHSFIEDLDEIQGSFVVFRTFFSFFDEDYWTTEFFIFSFLHEFTCNSLFFLQNNCF